MKQGEIIFVRTNSLVSKMIRFFDKGKFSHVGIALDENHILDARLFGGVRRRHFNFNDYEVVKVNGDMEQALQFVGYKYDLWQFIWYGFRYGDKVWNNPNELICSELIAHYLLNNEYLDLTPNELYEKLIRHSDQYES